MNKNNKTRIKHPEHNLKFKWKTQSLFDFIASKSPALISFKVNDSAQIIFETDTTANIKKQTNLNLTELVIKMESLLFKTNRAELIFIEKKDSFGVIKDHDLNNNIVNIGKKKINSTTAFMVGILRENYTTTFNKITLFCDIQAVSSKRLTQIKNVIN